jgi:hypothetical protein
VAWTAQKLRPFHPIRIERLRLINNQESKFHVGKHAASEVCEYSGAGVNFIYLEDLEDHDAFVCYPAGYERRQ